MKVLAKSIIVSRRKVVKDETYNCVISLFNQNNPHLGQEEPFDIVEFDNIHKVIIKNLNVNYLLFGNDIVINNLKSLDVSSDKEHVTIYGEQE